MSNHKKICRYPAGSEMMHTHVFFGYEKTPSVWVCVGQGNGMEQQQPKESMKLDIRDCYAGEGASSSGVCSHPGQVSVFVWEVTLVLDLLSLFSSPSHSVGPRWLCWVKA
jgi:hypothetical protein